MNSKHQARGISHVVHSASTFSGKRQLGLILTEGRTGILARCRAPLLWVGGFSLLINVLMLTSSLCMMQVYDRVLSSGSLSTSLCLSLIAKIEWSSRA